MDHLITFATFHCQLMPKYNKPATRLKFLINNMPLIVGSGKQKKKHIHDVIYFEKKRANTKTLSEFSQVVIVIEGETSKLFLRCKHLTTTDSLIDAIPTMLAYYYVFDMDYPLYYDVAFHILQYILFADSIVPINLKKQLDKFNDTYTQFKIDRLKQQD